MKPISLRGLVLALWWAIGLLVLIGYARARVDLIRQMLAQEAVSSWEVTISVLEGAVVAGIILVAFSIGAKFPSLLKKLPSTSAANSTTGFPFPLSATLPVALWLALISAIMIVSFVTVMSGTLGGWISRLLTGTEETRAAALITDIQLLLVAMFAAGVGSMVTTVLGYLTHASEAGDFKLSYVPWYFARPLIGVLMGAVFFCVLKGGLITVGATGTELNSWGVAGLGTLVGLFSKNAVEKLREVFETMFS